MLEHHESWSIMNPAVRGVLNEARLPLHASGLADLDFLPDADDQPETAWQAEGAP